MKKALITGITGQDGSYLAELGRWTKMWAGMGMRLEQKAAAARGFYRLSSLARLVSNPRRWIDLRRGQENFHFPGTWRLFDMVDSLQIVHCFNCMELFDLRALSSVSTKVPFIVDLRDAWLLSGHCAHSVRLRSLENRLWKLPGFDPIPGAQP